MSRNILARYQQDRWEYHMLGLCVIDNHLNDEIEMASAHRSIVLNHLVEQTNRVKDLWLEFQRKSDNGHVVEDTAVQMAIEQHGLQSNNFYQPPSRVKKVISKHKNKHQSKSESKSRSKSRNKSESKSGSKSESKSQIKSEIKSRSKSKSKSRNKSESKSGSKSESKSRSKSKSKSCSKSRKKSQSKSMSKPQSKPSDTKGDDVFNEAVSAAIDSNGLMTTTTQPDNM